MVNRLSQEKSPYLLRHATNPVDWYPWGDEAFTKARQENKPIFLSIGYSTCHWCHVMEEESFSDPGVASTLNDVFINIKVDREELPTVDSLYMELAQALTAGHGGWPLNLVLTPDLKPFFATTYLPPTSQNGSLGLKEFAEQIRVLWNSSDKEQLEEQATKVVSILEQITFSQSEENLDESLLKEAVEQLYEGFDPIYGGLKGHHKFPMAYLYPLLLAYSHQYNDSRALFLAELSLDKMLLGGIYDALSGGFARYAVDARWHIPHFEKMLSDNALMAEALLTAFLYTEESAYLEGAKKTMDYILYDFKAAGGGFCSALDADLDGREGLYYTWDFDEAKALIDEETFPLFAAYYSFTEEGNFNGRNVLYAQMPLEEFAEELQFPIGVLKQKLEEAKRALYKARSEKERPFLDDKIICSNNGIMLHALSRFALYLDEASYLNEAELLASFLKKNLFIGKELFRRLREQDVRFKASFEDYAFLIQGLISLYEVSGKSEWIQFAIELTEIAEGHFANPDGGYFGSHPEEATVLRRVELIDGSEPSANAVHAENLLRLYQITQNKSYYQLAEQILRSARMILEKYPSGGGYHLRVLQRLLDKKAKTVVIAINKQGDFKREIREGLKRHYLPHVTLIWKEEGDTWSQNLPSLKDKIAIDGQTTLYVCHLDRCLPPVWEKEAIEQTLRSL